MVKEGKSLTVPTPWDETLEPSASVTEGKGLVEDKEENKDLLPVIWSVAPESKTQGPVEEDWVRPTKDVPLWATEAVELENYWSLYHLRNLLNITSILDETEEILELKEAAEDAIEELEETRLRMAHEGRAELNGRRSELTLRRRRLNSNGGGGSGDSSGGGSGGGSGSGAGGSGGSSGGGGRGGGSDSEKKP